jgi:GNAT superfamily N-acetyltransferase
MLHVIRWSEFCEGMADHWHTKQPETIPIWNNPFGIVQYPRERWAKDILCFPCAWVEDGVTKGYTSVYNISDTVLRTRGVYVLPAYRGNGIGPKMMRASWDLFPNAFSRVVEWFKESDSHWHSMKAVPGTALEWSSFSKCTLALLYADREPRAFRTTSSERFIAENRGLVGLNGHYNMQGAIEDFDAYFDAHRGNYPIRKFDLNFRTTEGLRSAV